MLDRPSDDVETRVTASPGEIGCLAIDDLVAMAEGTLPPARADVVLGHVDRCAVCAEVIANLGSLEGPSRCVGRYQIERLIGSGGMGIVYAAFDPELQRRVAIKLVRPDSTNEALQGMIVQEARTLARLSHPNIVAVHDVGEHDGEVYIATEFVDGVTLADWQIGRSTADLIGAWAQVARGLAAAHAAGVVHRDVKPSNVLVSRDGRARIGDFGIASRVGSALDGVVESVAGTPAYMAPEQRAGKVDTRSDQFSTAVAITEAITGKRSAAGDTVSLAPPLLAAALTRALASDPDTRFATMTDFADALVKAISPPRRSRIVVLAATAGLVVATVVVATRAGDDPACRVTPVPAEVWSEARAAALATKLPFIPPSIASWVTHWSTMAADVCISSAHDATIQAARHRCLARAMTKLDALLDRWEAAPPRGTMALHSELERLPRAVWCSHANVLAAGEPADPPTIAAIAAIEGELEALNDREASVAALEELLVRARATNHGPLVRVVASALAMRQVATSPVAIQTMRTAIAAGPDDFSKVAATVQLIAALSADPGEAEALANVARVRIAALGGDPALEAELDFYYASILRAAARHHDAIDALVRARQGMSSAYGADSPQVATALVALSSAYYGRDGITSKQASESARAADAIFVRHHILVPSALIPTTGSELVTKLERLREIAAETDGPRSESMFNAEVATMDGFVINEKLEQALVHARAANELGVHLGLTSWRVPYVRSQIANVLGELGRADEGIPFARDALAVAGRLQLDQEVSTARSILGRLLIETGRHAEARPLLTAALRWLTSTNQPARLRGRTRFLLAMVTGNVDDAQIARSELESFLTTPDADVTASPVGAPYLRKMNERRLAEIDAWLAARSK